MTTGFDLDEIERLLAAATPGEWRVELDMRTEFRYAPEREEYEYIAGYNILGDVEVIGCEGIIPSNHSEHDAALIVAARNSLPAILTEIRELRAENARLQWWQDEVLKLQSDHYGNGVMTHLRLSEFCDDARAMRALAALGEPQ